MLPAVIGMGEQMMSNLSLNQSCSRIADTQMMDGSVDTIFNWIENSDVRSGIVYMYENNSKSTRIVIKIIEFGSVSDSIQISDDQFSVSFFFQSREPSAIEFIAIQD